MSPETMSRKYLLAVISPMPPGGPESSHVHFPSTYSKTAPAHIHAGARAQKNKAEYLLVLQKMRDGK